MAKYNKKELVENYNKMVRRKLFIKDAILALLMVILAIVSLLLAKKFDIKSQADEYGPHLDLSAETETEMNLQAEESGPHLYISTEEETSENSAGISNETIVPEETEDVVATYNNMYVTAFSGLNLRQSPGGEILTTVSYQSVVSVNTAVESEGFYPVKVGDMAGYMSKDYLSNEKPEEAAKPSEGKYLGRFRLTAYCPCRICNGNNPPVTYSGTPLTPGLTIAVDKSVIPLGSYVYINGHRYQAQDTGSKIVGNRIDILLPTHSEAWDFGLQYADVYAE